MRKISKSRAFLRSYEWKELRVKALNRDECKCMLCGSHNRLNVHHILYRKFYGDLKLELDNLLCVCTSCHYKIHKGVGNFILLEWLRANRPEQYEWIMAHI